MTDVFIDGSAGTTGLRIRERLEKRADIRLITLPEADRKDPEKRREALNDAQIVFLCLPDDAAREAAGWIGNGHTCVIDTSTAHRVHPDWTYGFPELKGQREKIRASRRIANPGCHASGLIALIAPLRDAGFLKPDAQVSCTSITGYSGGGKKMIAEYEGEDASPLLRAPRFYGLSQQHKHLPEMKRWAGLENDPVFMPVVCPYYAGMETMIPLSRESVKGTPEEAAEILASCYRDESIVRFESGCDESGFLSACAFAGRDDMQLSVFGNGERFVLTARFDNLGKGASGAAIQNMNLLLGVDEKTGLVTGGTDENH